MSSIKEVAQRAGVGVGTVSRVLNDSGYVSAPTKERVERAIVELGYVPNEMGRNLQAQRSRLIALIVPSIHHPLFAELAYAVEQELGDASYRMMLGNSAFDAAKEAEFLGLLRRNVIDGIVIVSNSDINDFIEPGMAVVTIDRHLSNEFGFVASDNRLGGELAARHLVDSGASQLAYVGSFPEVETEVLKRRTGFVAEAERLGVPVTVFDEPFDPAADADAARAERFVAQHPEVDGVFAVTDMLALEVLKAYDHRGRSVPGDVQVVGFDGIDLGLGDRRRPLTSIRQPVGAIGTAAAQLVLASIDGRTADTRVVLPVDVLQGASTRGPV